MKIVCYCLNKPAHMETIIEKVFMRQTHGTTISFIEKEMTLHRPLHVIENVDGLITERKNVALIAHGADCLMLALWDNKKIGICHAGWRGFTDGMLEQMLSHFSAHPHAFAGPFHHLFEIQKDECYERIKKKCGELFFEERENKFFFNFKEAIESTLKKKTILIGIEESTFENPQFASWRRDKKKGNGTQNRLAVWRDIHGDVSTQLFLPSEQIIVGTLQ